MVTKEDREEIEHYDKSHPHERGYKKVRMQYDKPIGPTRPTFGQQVGSAARQFGSDIFSGAKKVNEKVQERHKDNPMLGRGKSHERKAAPRGNPFGDFGSGSGMSFGNLLPGNMGFTVGSYGPEPTPRAAPPRRKKRKRRAPQAQRGGFDYIQHMNSMPDQWRGLF
jgi:hypothetical protein